MNSVRSVFSRSSGREERGHFEFATIDERARSASGMRKQPGRSARIEFIEVVGGSEMAVGNSREANNIGISGNAERDTAAVHRVAFGCRERNEQSVTHALRFSEHRIYVGIDRDVNDKIAKFSVVRVKSYRRSAHIVGSDGLSLCVGTLGKQPQLLQELLHTLRFGTERGHGLLDADVAVFEHVGRSANGCNSIAEGMAYAA